MSAIVHEHPRASSYRVAAPIAIAIIAAAAMLPVLGSPVTLLFEREFSAMGWGDYRWARRALLWPHAAGALVAMLVAPTQFVPGFRRRWPTCHRVLGRLYFVTAAFAAASALVLSMLMGSVDGRWSSLVLSLLWLVALACGFVAILNRKIALHRVFMIRAFVLMLAFVSFGLFGRFADDVLSRGNLDWLYWLAPYLVTEIWLGWIRPLAATASRPLG